MTKLAIYSCNGFAREVVEPAEQYLNLLNVNGEAADIVFVEDDKRLIG